MLYKIFAIYSFTGAVVARSVAFFSSGFICFKYYCTGIHTFFIVFDKQHEKFGHVRLKYENKCQKLRYLQQCNFALNLIH